MLSPEPVVLPRRVVPQPRPFLVEGGDCGACVLAGALGLTVPEVYARTVEAWWGKRQSLNEDVVARAVTEAARDGVADRAVTRPAHWTVEDRWATWGACASRQWQPWAEYLRMAFDAGYYGLACVSMDGLGSNAAGPDHWVLLCGWRPGQDGTVLDEVLVSCSARHPEGRWIRARDFLARQGGFNALLVRPVPR